MVTVIWLSGEPETIPKGLWNAWNKNKRNEFLAEENFKMLMEEGASQLEKEDNQTEEEYQNQDTALSVEEYCNLNASIQRDVHIARKYYVECWEQSEKVENLINAYIHDSL